MIQNVNNIILIGMPGSGKSTLGKELSQMIGWDFLDSDQLVTDNTGKTPKQIVAEHGRDYFMNIQDEAVLQINRNKCVIATGGGMVHSSKAMSYLKDIGFIIYLKTDYSIIEDRMDPSRKLVRTNSTLLDLYLVRDPLYIKYADGILECDTADIQLLCKRLIKMIEQQQSHTK